MDNSWICTIGFAPTEGILLDVVYALQEFGSWGKIGSLFHSFPLGLHLRSRDRHIMILIVV